MNDRMRARRVVGGVLVALVLAVGATAQPRVTTPKEHFGFNMGDDYRLANYTQIEAYWKLLDQQSDRMILQDMGKTAEGRTQWMAVITSPENHKKLARYKEIARKLALAEGLTDDQARALAREGKAVVWFDGGLHATEVLNFTQLTETVFQLVSRNDDETLRFLRDCIILAVHANPDGNELVSNWYMRHADETKRTTGGVPRLYQKYIGHDNNRDFYANNQAESTNMSRALFREWFPQIMYNHHQTGPTGTVLFAPPFRDPHNYNFHPLMVTGLDLVGAAMHNRFVAENKPGATMRRGANYSTWYNGGLRTTTYFHNMIGLLTESIGNPTPMEIPFVPQRTIMSGDLPFPITPQKWHFRQSVEYSLTANRAVFDVASRYRETFLYNIYQAGRDAIAKGSTDSWTIWPKRIAAVQAAIAKDRQGASGGEFNPAATVGGFSPTADIKYFSMLRDPANRDPRAYILPSSQRDFLTATKFMNMLIKSGITVHRATADFVVGGTSYPKGSYVVKTAQAFRPHVLDMFEPQDHPNDVPAPGAPPTPPYDNAGYTLAFQMGVQFDRILDAVEGPFEKIPDLITPAPATVPDATGMAGYVIDHAVNDAVVAVNRLLKNGDEVYFIKGPVTVAGRSLGFGAIYVPARAQTRAVIEGAARDRGLDVQVVKARPSGESYQVRPVRIGLWDRYGGSMPSGWIRWMLEQYEFPFEVVYPQALDAGSLNARFDVLVFPDGAIPENDRPATGPAAMFAGQMPSADSVPEEFRAALGATTVARTVPSIKAFVESGGTVLAIGESTALAHHLSLPMGNHLVERQANGNERNLPRERFYVPGSVLRAAVDASHPLAWGMPAQADVFFENSPVFRLEPSSGLKGVTPVAWFDSDAPLRSGWAWGQAYLDGGVAVAAARVGKGQVFLYGPEVTFRAQPHGTFKLFFNGLYLGGATHQAGAGTGGTAAQ